MCGTRTLDLINVNAYTKFGEIYQFVFKIVSDRQMDGMTYNPNPI